MADVRKSIVRVKPSHPSRRQKELWEVEAERDLLAVANGRQIAEIMHCSEDYARAQLRERAWAGLKIAGRWHMTVLQIIDAIGAQSTEAREPLPAANPVPRFRRRRQAARSA